MSRVASLALLVAGCTCGATLPAPSEPAAEPDEGKWFAQRYRTQRFDPDLTETQREQLELLEAIGYADGTMPFTGATSVTAHDPARAWQGLNFYNSGHGPEAVLVDMDGRELHRWRHEFWDAFPRYPVKPTHGSTHNWRRAWLLPGGHVLAIHEGLGMIRIDADSRLMWANPGRMHHDAEIEGDVVWTLAREARIVTRIDPERPILEDFVVALDLKTGEERARVSILEALERSEHAALLDRRADKADIFHTNSIRVLDGSVASKAPAFQEGRLLLSIRNLSALVVLDVEQREVVWSHTGEYRLQHDPTITADGHLMVFDNQGGGRHRARVLTFSLPDMKRIRMHTGVGRPLDSATLGAARELPNGHLLITESEQGRAYEVTADDEIVWEFHNPHVAGPDGQYVAALFEVARVPPDLPVDWASGAR